MTCRDGRFEVGEWRGRRAAAARPAPPIALPRNGATGRPYAGLNVLLLWIAGRCYASAEWYTFHQARALGACVRKGERGTAVTLWREITRRNAETGDHNRPALELTRLTLPRRVYTQAHMDVVAESVEAVYAARESARGLKMTYEPRYLRFFQARFEPL